MVPFVPLIAVLAGAALFVLTAAGPLRNRVRSLPPAALVAPHLLRGAGAAFVILGRKSLLPSEVAERFGIGEAAVAILGAGVLWLLTMPIQREPRSIAAWSAFGLINLGWFPLAWMREAPASADAWRLAAFPLGAYFWIVVPVAVATHLELLRRAIGGRVRA